MLKFFGSFIYKQLSKRDLESDNERYLFLYIFLSSIYAGIIHLVYLCFFGIIHVQEFAIINILSVLIYCFVCFTVRKKKYFLSVMIINVEVVLYVILSILFMGLVNNCILNIILILTLQMMVPYAKVSTRAIIGFAIWLCSLVVIVAAFFIEPKIYIGNANYVLSIFNIQATIIGVVAIVCTGNLINAIIIGYNANLADEYKIAANTDPLTGLPNRRKASLLIEDLIDSEERWYVAMLDIDDFKQVNDKYGHNIGDDVLKTVASVMNNLIRKSDSVFRWGGEEFLICLRGVNKKEAYDILEKIRKGIEKQTIKNGDEEIKVTVTMGATVMNTNDISDSVEKSDELLYQGKQSGKNKVVIE